VQPIKITNIYNLVLRHESDRPINRSLVMVIHHLNRWIEILLLEKSMYRIELLIEIDGSKSADHFFQRLFSSSCEAVQSVRARKLILRRRLDTGLPDFSWYNKPKHDKIYQMNTRCTKWIQDLPNDRKIHIPNGPKIYLKCQFQGLSNYTKIWNWVWKCTIWQPWLDNG
jgi:hypothetical protein